MGKHIGNKWSKDAIFSQYSGHSSLKISHGCEVVWSNKQSVVLCDRKIEFKGSTFRREAGGHAVQ